MYSGPVHKKILLGLILVTSTFIMAQGQITSGTASRVDSLDYPDSPGRDPLFVFYQTNGVYAPGSLTATLPGTGSYNFQWSRYNPDTPGFDPPFSSENGTQSSTITDLEEGGYRVRILDGNGTDTTLLAWVMLDNLTARVDKTEDDKLPPDFFICEKLALYGYVTTDTFFYYDPITHAADMLTPDYKFKWTSDNDDLRIPGDSIFLAPNLTYSPPIKDTWYILTATDDLGMKDVDSVFYESIQTRAKFKVEYYDKVTGEWDESLTGSWSKDKGSLDATLTVRFINESENGARFNWVFLDTLGGIKQEAITYDLEENPEFTYETADKYYYPYLFSVSEEGCIDSTKMEAGIFVVPSQLAIPNVFTPNGDGVNDLFIFKHQSLKSCRVTIVDRTGKVVYKREIDDIYDWDGWDGNMHESDRRAPEGQYYYVVEATGYDGIEYMDPTLWSQMKIFGGPGKDKSGSSGGNNPGSTPGNGNGEQSQTLYTGWLYLFRH